MNQYHCTGTHTDAQTVAPYKCFTQKKISNHTHTHTPLVPPHTRHTHTHAWLALNETRTHTHIHVRIFSTHFGKKKIKMNPSRCDFPISPDFFWPQKFSYQKRTSITVSFLNFFCFFSSWNIAVLGVFSRSQKFFTIRWCWYWCWVLLLLGRESGEKKKRTNERKTKRGKFRRTDPLDSLPSNRILLLDGHTCTFPFARAYNGKKEWKYMYFIN